MGFESARCGQGHVLHHGRDLTRPEACCPAFDDAAAGKMCPKAKKNPAGAASPAILGMRNVPDE
jgi:hypothetical protein